MFLLLGDVCIFSELFHHFNHLTLHLLSEREREREGERERWSRERGRGEREGGRERVGRERGRGGGEKAASCILKLKNYRVYRLPKPATQTSPALSDHYTHNT